MQLSAVLNIFIGKTYINSTFTNDLKRKYFFFENVHSYKQKIISQNQDTTRKYLKDARAKTKQTNKNVRTSTLVWLNWYSIRGMAIYLTC